MPKTQSCLDLQQSEETHKPHLVEGNPLQQREGESVVGPRGRRTRLHAGKSNKASENWEVGAPVC